MIFDFYIPKLNLCIEYNGEQHYRSVEYFGGDDGFELNKKRDNIKKKYCEDNGINLQIISYEDDIKQKLNEILYRYNF